MQLSDDVPDEVPVTDAVEQQREAIEPGLDGASSADSPFEAAEADWLEQMQSADVEPDDEGLRHDM
jgi:hypothetical protein